MHAAASGVFQLLLIENRENSARAARVGFVHELRPLGAAEVRRLLQEQRPGPLPGFPNSASEHSQFARTVAEAEPPALLFTVMFFGVVDQLNSPR